jgi:hypothetical protein
MCVKDTVLSHTVKCESIVSIFETQVMISQTNQTEVTESDHMTTTCSQRHPFSYQPPTHRRLLVFPVCVIIIGWRLLCHHKSAFWYSFLSSICFVLSCPWSFSWDHHDVFQLKSRLVLSLLQMVKTLSIPSPDTLPSSSPDFGPTGKHLERIITYLGVQSDNVALRSDYEGGPRYKEKTCIWVSVKWETKR